MGRAADPWRAAETWIQCLASHSVPLHATAGYPPTPTWRTLLRNQAFAIGTIGLGEAGRLSDELLALVRGWFELVVRCVTKVRDRIPCGFIERSSTLHPMPPYRSSNLTDWRDSHNGSIPVPPPPTTLGGRAHWTMTGRPLSPYRSRASPRRKPQAFKILHDEPLLRAGARRAAFYGAMYCTSATNDSLKNP